jgi:rare lipoprotein A
MIDIRFTILAAAASFGFVLGSAAPAHAFAFEGIASWYGEPFHGRQTASGEIFDMHEMTAAHKHLPLGTKLRVINPENGAECEVTVNDRGPYIAGRVLDLSRAAANQLGLLEDGVGHVECSLIDRRPKAQPAESPSSSAPDLLGSATPNWAIHA